MLQSVACATRPKRDPEQSQIRYQLGVEYYRGRRVEPALEELKKAQEADPENAEVFNMLGIIALRQGHDYLAQVEGVDCLRGTDAQVVRGDATRKFREAEQHLHRAVELRSDFSEAWNNLAVAALALQDWDQAVDASRNALKEAVYGEPEVARANLGWALYQKKELQGAWKELHEAAARSPGFCVGRYRLAKVYMERGDLDQAVEEVDAVTSNKQCPIQEAFLLGGMVHEKRRDSEGAKALFKRCTEMAPRSCVADECKRFAQLIQ